MAELQWKVRKAEVVGKDKINLTIAPYDDYSTYPKPPFEGGQWRWIAVSEELIKDMRARWSSPVQIRIVGGIGEDILEMEIRKPYD